MPVVILHKHGQTFQDEVKPNTNLVVRAGIKQFPYPNLQYECGMGKCAKCALKKADKCQNVVEVKDVDKTATYKLTGDVSKGFHKEICGETKKVEVVGEVSEADGKKWLTVSSIKAK